MIRTLIKLLIIALMLASAPDAFAKNPLKEFNKAAEMAEKGNLKEAVRIWLSIADQIPDKYKPKVQKNLGLAYKKLGKLPQAWHHLSKYLISESMDQNAAAWRDDAERKLIKTHRRVTISCQPFGTRITLGESEIPKYPCPLTWWMTPGKQTFRAHAKGHQTKKTTIEVTLRGGSPRYTVKLDEMKAQPAKLEIAAGKGAVNANVYVNDDKKGVLPFQKVLKPGTYRIRVHKPGHKAWKKTIVLKPGDVVKEIADTAPLNGTKQPPITNGGTDQKKPPKKGFNKGLWKWVALGTGVGIMATGGILHLLAAKKNSDLIDKYPDEPGKALENMQGYNSDFDEQVVPLQTTAVVLYGVGAVAAVGSIYLFVTDTGPKKKKTTAVTPLYIPGGFGWSLQTTF